jgi:hypothetical protein
MTPHPIHVVQLDKHRALFFVARIALFDATPMKQETRPR